MPGLNEQCLYISSVIRASQFTSNKFAGSKWHGIADVVMTTGEEDKRSRKEPMIISQDGGCEQLSFDDRYPMQSFYEVDDLRYSLSPIDSGAAGTTRTETAEMRLIFWADRTKTGIRPEQLIAAVEAAFPIQFNSALSQSFGNALTTIEMGTVEDDPYAVFSKEWPGSEFEFFTTTLLFSVGFKIVNTFNADCFELCS